MPPSTAPIGNFTISILDYPSATNKNMYMTDQSKKAGLLTAKSGMLKDGWVHANYNRTYFTSPMKIVLILSNPVMINGTIWI